jgi:hypothetical protein
MYQSQTVLPFRPACRSIAAASGDAAFGQPPTLLLLLGSEEEGRGWGG